MVTPDWRSRPVYITGNANGGTEMTQVFSTTFAIFSASRLLSVGIAGIGQDRQPAQARYNLMQEFELPLGGIGRLTR